MISRCLLVFPLDDGDDDVLILIVDFDFVDFGLFIWSVLISGCVPLGCVHLGCVDFDCVVFDCVDFVSWFYLFSRCMMVMMVMC